MEDDLIRRAEDLAARCARRGILTNTQFLTPAEGRILEGWAKRGADCAMLLHGGYEGAERAAAFFLPDWMDASGFDPAEHICALEGVAAFGAPGHRDWLGAALGLGIGREWLGDILVEENRAVLLCLRDRGIRVSFAVNGKEQDGAHARVKAVVYVFDQREQARKVVEVTVFRVDHAPEAAGHLGKFGYGLDGEVVQGIVRFH